MKHAYKLKLGMHVVDTDSLQHIKKLRQLDHFCGCGTPKNLVFEKILTISQIYPPEDDVIEK